ncbi:MAG: NUDIX domain-containing protein [Candidatus Sungbacteria bacterium]|nr:NUDIX domain-containing protein [Candidatus Sungbacteria bacterium]
MPVERSAGAVVIKKEKGTIEYLLIQHPDSIDAKIGKAKPGHWDFPKGHIEKGETTEKTVRREVKEETGISEIEIIPGFKETIRYFVKIGEEKRMKFVAFFLARTETRDVKISFEHQDYTWLPYEEASKKLTYANAKKVLQKAHGFIRDKNI